ncbi:hypothetical protein MRB53_008076 [Persea americana]|uniref:Uncharacterized protein n=1 Tax=Persea americana TaxID=3435 RepID=A0ACC2ML28_PERAE|nr:hypothetical protein MRB53_008076 [Persea americana]
MFCYCTESNTYYTKINPAIDSSSPHHQIPATQIFLKFFISDCDLEEIGDSFFEAILKACQTLYWIFPNPFSQLEHEPGTRAIVSILRFWDNQAQFLW